MRSRHACKKASNLPRRNRRLQHQCWHRERVEGIFYDIVSGRADDVEKELAAKFGQAEARPDFATVENDRTSRRSEALATILRGSHHRR